MRAALLVFALLLAPHLARAIDGTDPPLRLGVNAGATGTLPIGQTRASGASDDEATAGLWVDLEPIVLEVRRQWSAAGLVRFRALGGLDTGVLADGLDPLRRMNGTAGALSSPRATMLQLGLKGRRFWGTGSWQPFVAVWGAYTTLGANYEAALTSAPPSGTHPATGAYVHRHRGFALGLGVGLRHVSRFRAFEQEVLLPVALELHYTHNFWLDLERERELETGGEPLLGQAPFLDYLGLTLTVGFLR